MRISEDDLNELVSRLRLGDSNAALNTLQRIADRSGDSCIREEFERARRTEFPDGVLQVMAGGAY